MIAFSTARKLIVPIGTAATLPLAACERWTTFYDAGLIQHEARGWTSPAPSLDSRRQVIEIASNDGYLLQFFVARGIPALGVEPAANVAKVANDKGIPTLARFFNLETATDLYAEGQHADLLLAYNCLDHLPDINDVVAGMRLLLKPHGVIHVEVPYLRSLVEECSLTRSTTIGYRIFLSGAPTTFSNATSCGYSMSNGYRLMAARSAFGPATSTTRRALPCRALPPCSRRRKPAA